MTLSFEYLEENNYSLEISTLRCKEYIYLSEFDKSITVYHPNLSYEYNCYIKNGIKSYVITKEFTEEEYDAYWRKKNGDIDVVDHTGNVLAVCRPLVKLTKRFKQDSEEFNHHREIIKNIFMQDHIVKELTWKLSFLGSTYEQTTRYITRKYNHYYHKTKWNLLKIFLQYSFFHWLFGLVKTIKGLDDIEKVGGIVWVVPKPNYELKTENIKDYIISTNGDQLSVKIYSKNNYSYDFFQNGRFNELEDKSYTICKHNVIDNCRCNGEVYNKSDEKYQEVKEEINNLFTPEMITIANYQYNIRKCLGCIR